MTLEDRIFDYMKKRERRRRLRRFGTLNVCPWCLCDIQTGDDWKIKMFEDRPELDEATCGQCGGTSLWVWGMGFTYMAAGTPPTATHEQKIELSDFATEGKSDG